MCGGCVVPTVLKTIIPVPVPASTGSLITITGTNIFNATGCVAVWKVCRCRWVLTVNLIRLFCDFRNASLVSFQTNEATLINSTALTCTAPAVTAGYSVYVAVLGACVYTQPTTGLAVVYAGVPIRRQFCRLLLWVDAEPPEYLRTPVALAGTDVLVRC
jgi:hypothetical protein